MRVKTYPERCRPGDVNNLRSTLMHRATEGQRAALARRRAKAEAVHKTTIWAVDDNEIILKTIEEDLTRAGFLAVRFFDNPHDLVAAYQEATERPQIIITDLQMQREATAARPAITMGGYKLIQAIAALDPGCPPRFIIHSGDTPPNLTEDTGYAGQLKRYKTTFVQKGYELASVVESIAYQIIDGIPAMTAIIPEKISTTKTETARLLGTPWGHFSGRIIHDVNNLVAAFNLIIPMLNESPNPTEDFDMIREALDTFFVFVEVLNQLLNIELIELIAHKPTQARAQKFMTSANIAWDKLPPENRKHYRELISNYFAHGFADILGKMEQLSRLFPEDATDDRKTAIVATNCAQAQVLWLSIRGDLKSLHDRFTPAGAP